MLAILTSAALVGIRAEPVQIEVNADEEGDPRLVLVGLPDAAVKESEDRVCSALANSGFRPLRARATINLAPGHLRKEGPIYDLPIALAILAATGQLETECAGEYVIAGELSLSGETRPVRGALAMAQMARKLGKKGLILPAISAEEAAFAEEVPVFRVESLRQALDFLGGAAPQRPLEAVPPLPAALPDAVPDFSELKGQPALRRAIEVAVSGAHNLLIIGPPGSGKSMAARRIPSLMPPPSRGEQLEIIAIHSAAGADPARSWHTLSEARPFRSPHHTASRLALVGGGSVPRPGEISLAHHGVLFLDELPEVSRATLEVLRQPLEDGEVTISRTATKLTFPCAFMLVAAMNPCPCGHLGDPRRRCACTPSAIEKYRRRISGPLLDRIDLHVEAPAVTFAELRSETRGESSAAIRVRVLAARERQRARFSNSPATVNARMTHRQIRQHCALTPALGDLLQAAMERLSLSARAYDRILKVARTIADLAGADAIAAHHLLEAIQYRSLDRELFR